MNETDYLAMIEEIKKAVSYLDWYFNEDDGIADKDAVRAYDIIRSAALAFLEIAKTKFDVRE